MRGRRALRRGADAAGRGEARPGETGAQTLEPACLARGGGEEKRGEGGGCLCLENKKRTCVGCVCGKNSCLLRAGCLR